MKYTLLPPQKTPKAETAHRRPANLGEHKAAFLNANNRSGFLAEEILEEPVSEELAALFTTTLSSAPKISKAERKRGLAEWHHKLVMAGYQKVDGVYVKSEKPQPAKHLTPLEQFERARRDPKWQKPWEHEAYHEAIFRKHIVVTRTHFSYRAHLGPLRDDEYRSRLDKLLDQLEQQSNIQNPALRKLVTLEKAERILQEQASQFTSAFNIDEFLGPIEPKSDPSGHQRINPYL